MLRDSEHDLLAFTDFPVAHWKKIWSTNPLERLNKEIKRRNDVVACSPTPPRCSASPAPSCPASSSLAPAHACTVKVGGPRQPVPEQAVGNPRGCRLGRSSEVGVGQGCPGRSGEAQFCPISAR